MIYKENQVLEFLSNETKNLLCIFWIFGVLNIISSTVRHWHEEVKGFLALDFMIFLLILLGSGCLLFFETRGRQLDWSQGKSPEANAKISSSIGKTLVLAGIVVFVYSMCIDIRDIIHLYR